MGHDKPEFSIYPFLLVESNHKLTNIMSSSGSPAYASSSSGPADEFIPYRRRSSVLRSPTKVVGELAVRTPNPSPGKNLWQVVGGSRRRSTPSTPTPPRSTATPLAQTLDINDEVQFPRLSGILSASSSPEVDPFQESVDVALR